MLDEVLLREKIKNSGKKMGYLADKLGISRQYFSQKCTNKVDFTNKETKILCLELNIGVREMEKIFFAKNVDKNTYN